MRIELLLLCPLLTSSCLPACAKRFSRLDLDSEKSEKTSEVFPENVEKKRGKKKKAWRRLFPK
eukprot:614835-Amorphochlora_amoeboformis.AAC.1